MIFSGFVRGTDQPALAGAQVDVNGRIAVTDGGGFFRVAVPDRRRFVVNISRQGYALASNTYGAGVVGGSWTLTRAEVVQVDPTQPIDVQNRRTPRECPGRPSDRLQWKLFPTLAVPQMQDGRGNVIPTPEEVLKHPGLPVLDRQQRERECGPGVGVRIPANSLVDAGGNAPAGPVEIQLSTVDLGSGNQMPGDYTVADGDKAIGAMQSWGAALVDLRAGGQEVDLRAGATAELIIPVDRVQIEAGVPLDPTIPLLSYDEPRGVWRQDGDATLDTSGPVPVYVAKVSHFTAYNMDLIKTDQSCVVIQNQGMPANYDLEVTVPQSGGAAPVVRVKTGVTGGVSETVLINLPASTNITLGRRSARPTPTRPSTGCRWVSSS